MAKRYPVAGCKFFISTAAMDEPDETLDATAFTAITWTEVKNWKEMGSIGDAAQVITDQIIGDARDHKALGTKNAGSMQNLFSNDPTDAGQQALVNAAGTNVNYGFKLEMNDKPATGSSPKNSLRYFVGLVATAQETGGTANNIRSLSATIEINSKIVRVAASAS
ncbi:hypothetical protein [Methylobacterium isbiliense]|uniref:Phage tail protein n=1 Tax=Methylobacterium isbiliense TaxID=315478 RepID=A0ABQ4SFU5_9HYPH|nr:hypothetical protein [Methylobacterium isbiliense]MDN3622605.1 hypothetical protein [Methylobacterium isbiliense]GJE00546.1 hypothetical protein GMJLKIPL_2469 [Methylobacterium isbiliense]